MKKRKTNFVDDVKVAQPVRHSRSANIDMVNAKDIGNDMGIIQEESYLGIINVPGASFSPGSVGGTVSTPQYPPSSTPVANAGPDITVQLPVTSVSLNGTASQNATSFKWLLTAAPAGSSASSMGSTAVFPVVGLTVAGTYTYVLTVTNSAGATATDSVNITVQAASQSTSPGPVTSPGTVVNVAPSVNAGPDQSILLPATAAVLNGSVSGGMNPVSKWTYTSGPQGAAPVIENPSSTQTNVSGLSMPGAYTFTLTAQNTSTLGTPPNSPSGSDTIVITVSAPILPSPASNSTIDTWDCNTLSKYQGQYNTILSDPTLDQQTRIDYENALLYITDKIKTNCVPSGVPTLETSTAGAPPVLPSNADIDAMDCTSLSNLQNGLISNAAAYQDNSIDLQNYTNTVNYVALAIAKNCQSSTAPSTYTSVMSPYGPSGSGGGGGGGGSSTPGSAPAQTIKRWWWLAVIVLVAGAIFYKPGMKAGELE